MTHLCIHLHPILTFTHCLFALCHPKGTSFHVGLKIHGHNATKSNNNNKKKRCMRAFNTTHSERITSWETHKAANYFQIFRSRWAKEAETLIPPRVTQSRENSSNSWVCVFFGFDKHSAERCANKYQNQSESTLKNLSNSAETAIKYNFLLTDPPLILQPTVI